MSCLANGESVTEAARAAGVAIQSVHSWRSRALKHGVLP